MVRSKWMKSLLAALASTGLVVAQQPLAKEGSSGNEIVIISSELKADGWCESKVRDLKTQQIYTLHTKPDDPITMRARAALAANSSQLTQCSAAPASQLIMVREAGKPPCKAHVIQSWVDERGEKAYLAQVVDNGQLLTIVESRDQVTSGAPSGEIRTRFYHWSPDNRQPPNSPTPPRISETAVTMGSSGSTGDHNALPPANTGGPVTTRPGDARLVACGCPTDTTGNAQSLPVGVYPPALPTPGAGNNPKPASGYSAPSSVVIKPSNELPEYSDRWQALPKTGSTPQTNAKPPAQSTPVAASGQVPSASNTSSQGNTVTAPAQPTKPAGTWLAQTPDSSKPQGNTVKSTSQQSPTGQGLTGPSLPPPGKGGVLVAAALPNPEIVLPPGLNGGSTTTAGATQGSGVTSCPPKGSGPCSIDSKIPNQPVYPEPIGPPIVKQPDTSKTSAKPIAKPAPQADGQPRDAATGQWLLPNSADASQPDRTSVDKGSGSKATLPAPKTEPRTVAKPKDPAGEWLMPNPASQITLVKGSGSPATVAKGSGSGTGSVPPVPSFGSPIDPSKRDILSDPVGVAGLDLDKKATKTPDAGKPAATATASATAPAATPSAQYIAIPPTQTTLPPANQAATMALPTQPAANVPAQRQQYLTMQQQPQMPLQPAQMPANIQIADVENAFTHAVAAPSSQQADGPAFNAFSNSRGPAAQPAMMPGGYPMGMQQPMAGPMPYGMPYYAPPQNPYMQRPMMQAAPYSGAAMPGGGMAQPMMRAGYYPGPAAMPMAAPYYGAGMQPQAMPMAPQPTPAPYYYGAGVQSPAMATPLGGTPGVAVASASQAAPTRSTPDSALPSREGMTTEGMIRILRTALYPSHREWAADQLGTVDWKSNPLAVNALVQAANEDPAAGVRAASVRSMVRMEVNTVPVVNTLQALRSDNDPRVQTEVDKALAKLAPSNPAGQEIQPAKATDPK